MKRGSALEMVGGIITRSHFLHPHISLALWRCGIIWEWAPWLCQGGSTGPGAVVSCHGSTGASTATTTRIPLDSAAVGRGSTAPEAVVPDPAPQPLPESHWTPR